MKKNKMLWQCGGICIQNQVMQYMFQCWNVNLIDCGDFASSFFLSIAMQASDRTILLEVSVAEAQQSESHIIEFQDWLNDVDAQLTARIDNDLTADDLPDDVQVNFSHTV